MVFSLDDVVGLTVQKEAVYDSLILPLQKKELYNSLLKDPEKIKERRNFLFHGPSGTGKTHLAKAIASEADVPVVLVQSTQLLQRYVGDGSKALRDLYAHNKGIIFIDEIDAIASKRSKQQSLTHDLLLQLLSLLDGVGSYYSTATIMATNCFDSIDPALLSRIPLSHQLYFPLPDAVQRERIISLQASYHNISDDFNCSLLVSQTQGYDGRQLEDLFAFARRSALKNDCNKLSAKDFVVK